MKVFVAGASGAIGRPLIAELVAQGHTVTGMTRSKAGAQGLKELGAEVALVDGAVTGSSAAAFFRWPRWGVVSMVLAALSDSILSASSRKRERRPNRRSSFCGRKLLDCRYRPCSEASSLLVETVMIAFSCDKCDKQLKVKDELAGKKVKCPGCGQIVVAPVLTAVSPAPQGHALDLGKERTSRPSVPPEGEERTQSLPPKNAGQVGTESLSDVEGQTALGADRAGQGTQALSAAAPDRNFYDFLAPPEKPDELGRLGPYRVLQVLGKGGMGVVFRAEDPHLERMVALKAMLPSMAGSPSSRERFFREAKAAAALKHPHIVSIHQVGFDRGAPFLAMEYLEGEPLDDRLKREPRLPVPEILRIGREIAKGLAAAHEKGLIHRDIKPANLWLEGKAGHVKILDFGLARAMGDTTHLTQSGAIIGTPAYMAPEQASGKPLDHRCDLFSLGCVLYRMSTGERPFKGEDAMSIISALALENPPPPDSLNSEVPAELSDLVMLNPIC